MKCRNEAVIGERSMMTLPGCSIDLPTLTDQDKEDITEFGVKQGVDMIAASFIRRAEDVDSVREVLGPTGAHIKVIAKIETSESLKNFDSILESADGIMIS